jgi:hypothetical protein
MPDITPFTNALKRRTPAMQLEVTLELQIKIEEEQLNINGLIRAVYLSQNEFGRMLLQEIIESIDRKACATQPVNDTRKYRNKGYTKRIFKTPMGVIAVRFTKLLDLESNRVIEPGKRALNVPAYKRWLPWCLTPAAGLLAKVSFAGSSKEATRLQGDAPAPSTIHRRIKDLVGDGSFTPYLRKRHFRYVMVDGTGARFQNRSDIEKDAFYEGEIRFAFASTGEYKPFELVGMWVQKSWQECAEELYGRMSIDKLEVLICDGGPGIEDAFMRSGMRVQRCQWHGKRDLSFILYQDGVKKAQQDEVMHRYADIPLVGWNKEMIETLKDKDVEELQILKNKTNVAFCDLYFFLVSKGYHNAAVYLRNLAKPFVSFISYLTETGKSIPATSNIIEGKISLFKNRIRSIGKRWSEQGLMRWLSIAVRKILPEFDWESLWDDITGNPLSVQIMFVLISTKNGCH